MANTILTPDEITDGMLAIFHDKSQLVTKVDRQYDSRFGNEGAKIGAQLEIRKPAQVTVRDGSTMSTQDFVEEKETLVVSTMKGVDLEFDSTELTLDLDRFGERVSDVAISRLVAEVETDVASKLYSQVGNHVYNASGLVWKDAVTANSIMTQNTASSSKRCTMADPMSQVNILNDTKGLFNSPKEIGKQYEEGILGHTGGSTWYETTYNPTIAIGADVAGLVNAAPAEGMTTLVLSGLSASQVIAKGTIVTVADSKMIQPETKKAYGNNKGLAVIAEATADGSGNVTLSILPLYSSASNGLQNISALPANGKAVTIVGSADTDLRQSVEFQKDFATFVTAKLFVPSGLDMASAREFEGVSLRLLRDYTINDDKIPCRVDVLYGSQILRPELACRMLEPNV